MALGLRRRLGQGLGTYIRRIIHIVLRDSNLMELRDKNGETLRVRQE
jgi:hypothetical protein